MASKIVHRRDFAWEPLLLPQKNGAGMMRVEGYLTGSGIFPYEQEDGSILREWRPPSEVSNATSIDSLRLVPVTIGHPKDPVTIDNVKDLGVGTVGDDVRCETQWGDEPMKEGVSPDVKLRCRLTLTDAKAIKVVEDKDLPEVSCGYTADLDMTPGVTATGEVYDAVQRRITYNHLAIGVTGRQGPGVSIRVDHKPPSPKKEEVTMKKLIIDGVSYDAPEQTIEAFNANAAKSALALASAVAALDEQKKLVADAAGKVGAAEAKADASAASEKAAKAELKALSDKVKAGVKERLSLERAAQKVMGSEAFEAANLGDADDDAVKVAVVKHVHPDRDLSDRLTLAGKGDIAAASYIASAFDFAVAAAHSDETDDDDVAAPTPEVVSDGAGSLRKRTTVAVVVDAGDVARAAMIKRREDASRQKPAA